MLFQSITSLYLSYEILPDINTQPYFMVAKRNTVTLYTSVLDYLIIDTIMLNLFEKTENLCLVI